MYKWFWEDEVGKSNLNKVIGRKKILSTSLQSFTLNKIQSVFFLLEIKVLYVFSFFLHTCYAKFP